MNEEEHKFLGNILDEFKRITLEVDNINRRLEDVSNDINDLRQRLLGYIV